MSLNCHIGGLSNSIIVLRLSCLKAGKKPTAPNLNWKYQNELMRHFIFKNIWIFPSSICWKGLKTITNTVVLNILCAWVVASKYHCLLKETGLSRWRSGKNSPANAGDKGLISVLGRSPGEGNGNPPQYSGLGNPHGQRCLAGCSSWGYKRVGHNLATKHNNK